jgi:hypothetical protein
MTSKFCTANPYLQISYSDGNLGRVMFTKNVRVAITVTALVIATCGIVGFCSCVIALQKSTILTTPCKVLLDSFIHPDPKILTTWLILAVVILIAAIIMYTVYKCFDNERKPYMKNNNAEQTTFLEKNCLSA